MSSSDFVVIGAGIAGASIAYELAAHASVVVLEAERAPGQHATGRSAALFSETYGNTTIRALSRASRAFLEKPPVGFSEAPLLQQRGVLYIADAAQSALLNDQLAAETAGRLTRVDPEEAFARVPILRRDRWSHFVLERDARDIDVDAVFQGFLRGAKARGAAIVTQSAAQVIERRGPVWHVVAVTGEYTAPVLINAAGAWADEIAVLAGGARIGLVPKRRTALLIDPPTGLAVDGWPVVVEAAESFYFKPDAGRLLVSPADETPMAPCDVQPDDLDVAIAVDRFEQATTLNVQRVRHSWAGLRSFVGDRAPIAGFDPGLPSFFWLAAQGGYGIQTAPALARLGAAMARGAEVPEDIAAQGLNARPLSPSRLRA